MKLKAIRCSKPNLGLYFEIFRNLANRSVISILLENNCRLGGKHGDETNTLTKYREKLVEFGYADVVKKADERFLKERLRGHTQEEWEKGWERYCKRCNIPVYPKDAL